MKLMIHWSRLFGLMRSGSIASGVMTLVSLISVSLISVSLISVSMSLVSCMGGGHVSRSLERDHLLSEERQAALDHYQRVQHEELIPDVVCAQCHPRQAQEYGTSTMRYGFFSPSFNALEMSLNQLSDGAFTHAGEAGSFCSDCHGPRAQAMGLEVSSTQASREQLSPLQAREAGIGCDLCHSQQQGRDPSSGLERRGHQDKLTSHEQLSPNSFHGYRRPSAQVQRGINLSSSEMCAPCHDVRPTRPDVVEGTSTLRSEDLFTEWEKSPWAQAEHPLNPLRGQPGIDGVHDRPEELERGEQVTCQDCHMSLYPWRSFTDRVSYQEHFSGVDLSELTRKAHKLYPVGFAAERGHLTDDRVTDQAVSSSPKFVRRRASTHYFTGVSHPLTPFSSSSIFDPRSMGLDGGEEQVEEWSAERSRSTAQWLTEWRDWRASEEKIDVYQNPTATHLRREALLRAALSLDLNDTVEEVSPEGLLTINAWVENIGAGHHVPAGFSQEREVWVAVTLIDQGRSCSADLDCADLTEMPLFLDSPHRECIVHNRLGERDSALPAQGSWQAAARAERSGVCGESGQCVVYRSGYLVDEDGDGRLQDEELRHLLIERDSESFDERCVISGPDVDQRLRGIERGLVHFTNALQRVEVNENGAPVEHPSVSLFSPSAEPFDPSRLDRGPIFDQDPQVRRSLFATQRALYEQSRYRPAPPGILGVSRRGLGVNAPTLLLANRAFNGQSLAPFEPRLARYELSLPSTIVGPLLLNVKVRFRFFSPRLLYTLIDRHPQLLREEMIDEGLEIIDMVNERKTIEVR